MKRTIRLTESDLHRIIEQVINEIGDTPKGQYMLGRLQGRQSANGNRQQAMDTMSYAVKQQGSRTPKNFQDHDVMTTANHMGVRDETNPQLSQDMMTDGSNIGNYEGNVRTNYLRGVSKFN